MQVSAKFLSHYLVTSKQKVVDIAETVRDRAKWVKISEFLHYNMSGHSGISANQDWSGKTVAELREELKTRNLQLRGRKADLIERLNESDSVSEPDGNELLSSDDANPACKQSALEAAKVSTCADKEDQHITHLNKKEASTAVAIEDLQKDIDVPEPTYAEFIQTESLDQEPGEKEIVVSDTNEQEIKNAQETNKTDFETDREFVSESSINEHVIPSSEECESGNNVKDTVIPGLEINADCQPILSGECSLSNVHYDQTSLSTEFPVETDNIDNNSTTNADERSGVGYIEMCKEKRNISSEQSQKNSEAKTIKKEAVDILSVIQNSEEYNQIYPEIDNECSNHPVTEGDEITSKQTERVGACAFENEKVVEIVISDDDDEIIIPDGNSGKETKESTHSEFDEKDSETSVLIDFTDQSEKLSSKKECHKAPEYEDNPAAEVVHLVAEKEQKAIRSELVHFLLPDYVKRKISVEDISVHFAHWNIPDLHKTWALIKKDCMQKNITESDYYKAVVHKNKEIKASHPVKDYWSRIEESFWMKKNLRACSLCGKYCHSSKRCQQLKRFQEINTIDTSLVEEKIDTSQQESKDGHKNEPEAEATAIDEQSIQDNLKEILDIRATKYTFIDADSELLSVPPQLLTRWLIKNFTDEKSNCVLLLKHLSPQDVLCPTVIDLAKKANNFCLNHGAVGNGAVMLQFKTNIECKSAKEELEKVLEKDVKIVHPKKQDEEAVKAELAFHICEEMIEMRSIVLTVPVEKSVEEIFELVPGALHVMKIQDTPDIKLWNADVFYIPKTMTKCFLVEYECPFKAESMLSEEIKIDDQQVLVQSLKDYKRSYHDDFWAFILAKYAKSSKGQYDKLTKGTACLLFQFLVTVHKSMLSDRNRLTMCETVRVLCMKIEQRINPEDLSSSSKVEQLTKLTTDLEEKTAIIDADTERRCKYGIKFPEQEGVMSAYTWKMHKLRQKRKSLKILEFANLQVQIPGSRTNVSQIPKTDAGIKKNITVITSTMGKTRRIRNAESLMDISPTKPDISSGSHCLICKIKGHSVVNCPRKELHCDRCHKIGHIHSNCCENLYPGKCDKCYLNGHHGDECPKNFDHCVRCGNLGHLVENCDENFAKSVDPELQQELRKLKKDYFGHWNIVLKSNQLHDDQYTRKCLKKLGHVHEIRPYNKSKTLFVSYMKKKDAEKALKELWGKHLYDCHAATVNGNYKTNETLTLEEIEIKKQAEEEILIHRRCLQEQLKVLENTESENIKPPSAKPILVPVKECEKPEVVDLELKKELTKLEPDFYGDWNIYIRSKKLHSRDQKSKSFFNQYGAASEPRTYDKAKLVFVGYMKSEGAIAAMKELFRKPNYEAKVGTVNHKYRTTVPAAVTMEELEILQEALEGGNKKFRQQEEDISKELEKLEKDYYGTWNIYIRDEIHHGGKLDKNYFRKFDSVTDSRKYAKQNLLFISFQTRDGASRAVRNLWTSRCKPKVPKPFKSYKPSESLGLTAEEINIKLTGNIEGKRADDVLQKTDKEVETNKEIGQEALEIVDLTSDEIEAETKKDSKAEDDKTPQPSEKVKDVEIKEQGKTIAKDEESSKVDNKRRTSQSSVKDNKIASESVVQDKTSGKTGQDETTGVFKCFKCKEVGHKTSDCKKDIPRCQKCKKYGHVDKDCEAVQCVRCNRYGHYSFDCNYFNYSGNLIEPDDKDSDENNPDDFSDLSLRSLSRSRSKSRSKSRKRLRRFSRSRSWSYSDRSRRSRSRTRSRSKEGRFSRRYKRPLTSHSRSRSRTFRRDRWHSRSRSRSQSARRQGRKFNRRSRNRSRSKRSNSPGRFGNINRRSSFSRSRSPERNLRRKNSRDDNKRFRRSRSRDRLSLETGSRSSYIGRSVPKRPRIDRTRSREMLENDDQYLLNRELSRSPTYRRSVSNDQHDIRPSSVNSRGYSFRSRSPGLNNYPRSRSGEFHAHSEISNYSYGASRSPSPGQGYMRHARQRSPSIDLEYDYERSRERQQQWSQGHEHERTHSQNIGSRSQSPEPGYYSPQREDLRTRYGRPNSRGIYNYPRSRSRSLDSYDQPLGRRPFSAHERSWSPDDLADNRFDPKEENISIDELISRAKMQTGRTRMGETSKRVPKNHPGIYDLEPIDPLKEAPDTAPDDFDRIPRRKGERHYQPPDRYHPRGHDEFLDYDRNSPHRFRDGDATYRKRSIHEMDHKVVYKQSNVMGPIPADGRAHSKSQDTTATSKPRVNKDSAFAIANVLKGLQEVLGTKVDELARISGKENTKSNVDQVMKTISNMQKKIQASDASSNEPKTNPSQTTASSSAGPSSSQGSSREPIKNDGNFVVQYPIQRSWGQQGSSQQSGLGQPQRAYQPQKNIPPSVPGINFDTPQGWRNSHNIHGQNPYSANPQWKK